MPVELRPYQEEAINLVIASYKNNPQGEELLQMPCASGKTVIFSHIIHSLARGYGLSAMVVCHLDELLEQAADKYRMVKPDAVIGKVGSGFHEYGGEVTVSSIQTISRPEHLKRLKDFFGTGKKLIVVLDEAHLSAATSYKKVREVLPDAFYLLVTATPKRLDGKPIINKPPLYQKTIIEMIREHYLCDVKAIAIKTEVSLDEVKSLAGDFNERDLDLAINTPARNLRIVSAYQQHAPGKRAIAFCVTIAHAEALAYAFNECGVHAACVLGRTPLADRKRLYKEFEAGNVLVLVSVNVLSIGFDSPRAEVAIMARPTQSHALYVQQAGRILRLAPGKQCATLIDITDNCQRHRLLPQNLRSAIDLHIRDNEPLSGAITRLEEEEAQEKRALIRKLNEKRTRDIVVNLFGLPEWVERPGGLFVLEVGARKHRIALVPRTDGFYDVQARLSPAYTGQTWMTARPLDWCMQHAEKKARQLLEEPHAEKLVDRNAAWRDKPVDPQGNQSKFLKWKKIPVHEGMTKGEASDLIDQWKEQDDAKKQAKAERQKARMQA